MEGYIIQKESIATCRNGNVPHSPAEYAIQWIPLNVDIYQGRILYYVYYITSDNLGSRLMWTKRAGPMCPH